LNQTTLFALSALLCGSTVALAQKAETPDWFKKLDRNGDGAISKEEMPKLFGVIDADKDGVGTVAEATVYFSKAQQAAANGKGKAKMEDKTGGRSAEAPVRFPDADLAFFEKKILPVLIKSCYECHSATSV
jgi:hypothetical protein